jgi:hypothetical protein
MIAQANERSEGRLLAALFFFLHPSRQAPSLKNQETPDPSEKHFRQSRETACKFVYRLLISYH